MEYVVSLSTRTTHLHHQQAGVSKAWLRASSLSLRLVRQQRPVGRLERWASPAGEEGGEPIGPAIAAARLAQEGYRDAHLLVFPPGTAFPVCSHVVDKKRVVVRGRLREIQQGQEVLLGAGDVRELPAGSWAGGYVVGQDALVLVEGARW